jgi:O-antigen ligase
VSSALAVSRVGPSDRVMATGASIFFGCGLILTAFGAASDSLPLIAAGAAALVLGIFPALQAQWVNPLIFLVLSLPLPAVFGNADVRIAATAPVTALVMVAYLCDTRPKRVIRFVDAGYTEALSAGVALLAIFTLTGATAINRGSAIRELFNLAIIFALFPIGRNLLSADDRSIPRLIRVVALLCGLCGFLAVLESLAILPAQFPRWGTNYYRAALGLGQPNGLGLFFALFLPFCAAAAWIEQRRTERTLLIVALIATIAGLFATFSRGAWISVIFGSLMLIFAGEWRRVLRILGSVVLAGIIIDLVTGGAIRDTAQRTLTDWVVEQRFSLMLAGVAMFAAHPLTGVGPGGFASELDTFGAQITALWDYLPTPHNAYIQMAAETGILGLLTYAVMLVVIGRSLVERTRQSRDPISIASLWAFGVLCCSGLFIWPFAHGTGQVAMLALAIGFSRPVTQPSQ